MKGELRLTARELQIKDLRYGIIFNDVRNELQSNSIHARSAIHDACINSRTFCAIHF